MSNRTDGPSLNAALAATGALLGAFSLLVDGRALARGVGFPRAHRLGRGHSLRVAVSRALRDRGGRLERREMVLLRLRSDDGLIGLGEAVPLSLRGGAA